MTVERRARRIRPKGGRENATNSPRRGAPPRSVDVADAAERATHLGLSRTLPVRRSGLRDPHLLLAALRADGGAWSPTLKLWLLHTWLAGDSHKVSVTAAQAAGLLGFAAEQSTIPGADDSELFVRGMRRAREATRRLADVGLAEVEQVPGRTPRLTLLREDGSTNKAGNRVRWTHPGAGRSKTAEVTGRPGAGFVQLPPQLFTRGWLVALSGRALLALLVIAAEQNDGRAMVNGTEPDPVLLTPSNREANYGMTKSTWQAAVRELDSHGIVRSKQVPSRDPHTLEHRKTVMIFVRPGVLHKPAANYVA
jgi:hypothetical protein